MLTWRQKMFADKYLECGDPVKAMREAGYKEKNAAAASRRLLVTPAVQGYIEERKKGKDIADDTEVLRYLTRVLRGEHGTDRECMRAEELLGVRNGLFQAKNITDTVAIIADNSHE